VWNNGIVIGKHNEVSNERLSLHGAGSLPTTMQHKHPPWQEALHADGHNAKIIQVNSRPYKMLKTSCRQQLKMPPSGL